ncbi:hypothetical protein GGR54DRAFT_650096 [Hypoxylon sp. NC1633]|nr:hypothetical protein GGR54DRAFT_650096 [Hypoxylon sp. NC1633]
MGLGTHLCTAAIMGLASLAYAEKGAAYVNGCVWHSIQPVNAYDIHWKAGSTGDKCMTLRGSDASMNVKEQGLTCISLSKVSVDSSWDCYFRESHWGMSYTAVGAAYSGSTSSKWTTGPFNSDITLESQSAGTNVCAEESHCTRTYIEWDNDSNANLFIVFEPGKVKKFPNSESIESEL